MLSYENVVLLGKISIQKTYYNVNPIENNIKVQLFISAIISLISFDFRDVSEYIFIECC